MQEFRDWLGAHECRFLTAFNVAFDREMMDRAGLRPNRHGLTWGPCVMLRAAPPMARRGQLLPPKDDFIVRVDGQSWRPPALWKAAQFYGVQPEGAAHRALTDARTAALVLLALLREAP